VEGLGDESSSGKGHATMTVELSSIMEYSETILLYYNPEFCGHNVCRVISIIKTSTYMWYVMIIK
jgi:hypothetical protein